MALSDFSRLNDIVSVRSPVSVSNARLPSDEQLLSRPGKAYTVAAPKTILFLSWGDAKPRYIQKYTNLYSEIFPEARVMLVESGMKDYFWRTERTSRKLAEPAVKILGATTDETLLVHVMSNAGSKQWCVINDSLIQSTGRSLYNAATVIDSAPGCAQFSQTWASLAQSLPRAFLPKVLLGSILGLILCLMHVQKYIVPGPDILDCVRSQMNDAGSSVKSSRRTYVFSEGDDIIGWEDVESHAKEAEKKGWVVELVKIHGSTHVGHLRRDPETYRQAIEKTWSGKSEWYSE